MNTAPYLAQAYGQWAVCDDRNGQRAIIQLYPHREQAEAALERLTKGPRPIKVGDIFVYSWGHEQTNVDFFQVVQVGKLGRDKKGRPTMRVTLRELAQRSSYDAQSMTGITEPDAANYVGEPHVKVATWMAPGGRGVPTWYLSSKYGSCELWDGTPRRYSCYG